MQYLPVGQAAKKNHCHAVHPRTAKSAHKTEWGHGVLVHPWVSSAKASNDRHLGTESLSETQSKCVLHTQ